MGMCMGGPDDRTRRGEARGEALVARRPRDEPEPGAGEMGVGVWRDT